MTPYAQIPKRSTVELIHHYWNLVLKWKWTIFIIPFLAVAGTVVFSLKVTPVFTAEGSIWIDDEPRILPFDEGQRIESGNTTQSHVYLLQSRALAIETIDKLKLNENPEFVEQPVPGKSPAEASKPTINDNLINSFMGSIEVKPIQGTRLVNVRFSHKNPKLAADILNAIFSVYVDMIYRKRAASSDQAMDVLRISIASLRTEIETREKQLNEFGLNNDILPLTTKETPTITRLTDFNTAITAATIDRINKLNYYNNLKSAPLGEIPDTPVGSIIQNLRTQYAALTREYATRLLTLKPEYPEMIRLKAQLDEATADLQNETQNLIRNAYKDYQTALQKEQALQRELDALKTEAYQTNNNSLYYNNLRIELESKKTLLESLTKRLNETDLTSGLKGMDAINVWIVNKADPPVQPTFPNKRKIVLMGLLIGLAGGFGLAFGIEYLNQTIKTSKDVTIATGLPTIGSIPAFANKQKTKGPGAEIRRLAAIIRGGAKIKEKTRNRKRDKLNADSMLYQASPAENSGKDPQKYFVELIASRKPQSIQAESFRSIRTTLLVSAPSHKVKSILFTSPLAGEGKSSIVSNLGITLAAARYKVVIVDSDLRKPKQHKIFGQDVGPGLTRFLSSDVDPSDLLMPTHVPNLFLINSGPRPANPIELLSLAKMSNLMAYLRGDFDYVLCDTPPILAVSDALAVSSLADAIILICRGDRTPIQALKQAKFKLDSHEITALGVILNDVNLVEQDGYYAREYYHYSQQG